MPDWLKPTVRVACTLLLFVLAAEDFADAIEGEELRWNLFCGLLELTLGMTFAFCLVADAGEQLAAERAGLAGDAEDDIDTVIVGRG